MQIRRQAHLMAGIRLRGPAAGKLFAGALTRKDLITGNFIRTYTKGHLTKRMKWRVFICESHGCIHPNTYSSIHFSITQPLKAAGRDLPHGCYRSCSFT